MNWGAKLVITHVVLIMLGCEKEPASTPPSRQMRASDWGKITDRGSTKPPRRN